MGVNSNNLLSRIKIEYGLYGKWEGNFNNLRGNIDLQIDE